MKDPLENIFKDKKGEFDFAEPNIGHFDRFEAKLKGEKSTLITKRTPWHWLVVAASVLLLFGFWLGKQNSPKGYDLADVSPKMEETQNFYLASIHKEIQEIKSQQNPENQKIIEDTFDQLKILEISYQKLTIELKESSEDKRVIYAMITNFQKRLEVLQNLMLQLEEFDSYKEIAKKEKMA